MKATIAREGRLKMSKGGGVITRDGALASLRRARIGAAVPLLESLGKPGAASRLAHELVSAGSDSRHALLLVAREALSTKRHRDAELALRRILARDPGDHDAVRQLFRAVWKQGRELDAVEELRRWVASADNPPWKLLQLLARRLAALEDWHGACRYYRRALELQSTNASLLHEYAEIVGRASCQEEVEALERALELRPGNRPWRRQLIRRYRELGNWYAAAATATPLAGTSDDWKVRRARYLLRAGAPSAAAEQLRTLNAEPRDVFNYHLLVGEVAQATRTRDLLYTARVGLHVGEVEDFQTALNAYQAALDVAEESGTSAHRRRALGRVSEVAERVGDHRLAEEAYRSLSEIHSEAKVFERLSRVQRSPDVAKHAEAARNLRIAYRMSPGQRRGAQLARTLARSGEWAEALAVALEGQTELKRIIRTQIGASEQGSMLRLMSLAAQGRTSSDDQVSGVFRAVRESDAAGRAEFLRIAELWAFAHGSLKEAYASRDAGADLVIDRRRAWDQGEAKLADRVRVAKALASRQRVAEAVEVLQEGLSDARARQDDEAELVIERLIADVAAVSGSISQVVALAARLRDESPLPLEREFGDLIRGRHVAVVGPSVPVTESGEEIDARDVVVRTKHVAPPSPDQADQIGSRTDVSYYAARDVKQLHGQIVTSLAAGELKMAVARPMSYRYLMTQGISGIRFYRAENRAYYRATPLGIQRILHDLLQFEPASIKLYNCDFFTGHRKFISGYRVEGRSRDLERAKVHEIFSLHDVRADFRFTRNLVRAGQIQADARASSILAMTETTYLELLEQRGVG